MNSRNDANPHMKWSRPREIVFIRHGESLRNVIMGDHYNLQDEEAVARLDGKYDHDIPLTERGHQQALISGPRIMADIGIPDFFYHSGYVRAQQTKDCLLADLPSEQRAKIQVRHSIKLRERDPGYTWHMTQAEVDRHFPWIKEYYRRAGKLFYRPPGGESILDVHDGRLHGLLNSVIRDRPGKTVWFVCHGHVMRAARILMERLTIAEAGAMVLEPVLNVAVTRYVYARGASGPRRTHLNKVYWE